MSDFFLYILLFCAFCGILTELITIIIPDTIISLTNNNSEELFKKKFYRFVFLLSGFYMIVVVLLLASGVARFQVYGFILVCMSFFSWLFKSKHKKNTCILVMESTLSLILLIDVARSIIREFV